MQKHYSSGCDPSTRKSPQSGDTAACEHDSLAVTYERVLQKGSAVALDALVSHPKKSANYSGVIVGTMRSGYTLPQTAAWMP